jgi:hypothetical protein
MNLTEADLMAIDSLIQKRLLTLGLRLSRLNTEFASRFDNLEGNVKALSNDVKEIYMMI